jgi:hypothetical protein
LGRESNVSEENIASIFRVEESAKQEAGGKQRWLDLVYFSALKMEAICSSKLQGNTTQDTALFF